MSIIADAIDTRHLLGFVYGGRLRVVEPHTYGIDAKGRRLLVAYQVEGESSEPLPAWRTFRESRMEDVDMLDQPFYGPREEYQYDDGLFETILAQLPARKRTSWKVQHRFSTR